VTGVADRHLRVGPIHRGTPSGFPGPLRPLLGRVDLEAAERAARDLPDALGADPDDEGLADTPRRVAAAFAEPPHPK
jgi:hypothetical protein